MGTCASTPSSPNIKRRNSVKSKGDACKQTMVSQTNPKIFKLELIDEDVSKIDLNDELKCAVCRDVCTAPPRECTHCAHLFCYKCIADLKTCPRCRTQPFDVRICWFASRLLNSVHVRCVQCGAMVVRTHLESHNAEVCEARLRQCSFPDSEFVAKSKQEATDHKKEQLSTTGAVAAASAYVDAWQLRLNTRISTLRDVFRFGVSLCALPGNNLLVAGRYSSQSDYEVPRVISLPDGHLSLNKFPSVVPLAAFDQRTDTLLLVVFHYSFRVNGPVEIREFLASLRRDANNWLDVDTVLLKTPFRLRQVHVAVCESRVLLGPLDELVASRPSGRNLRSSLDSLTSGSIQPSRSVNMRLNCRLDVYDVSAEHKLQSRGSALVDEAYLHFASTRLGVDTGTLVAFVHSKSVSLRRLVDTVDGGALRLRLDFLHRIELDNPSLVVFRGDSLLVAARNIEEERSGNQCTKKDAIVSFRVAGGRLVRRRQVLDASAGLSVAAWCVVGEQLVVSDSNSNDLLIYSSVCAALAIDFVNVDLLQSMHAV